MRWVAGEKISVVSPLLTKRPRVFRDCVTALVDAHACLLFHGGLVHMDPHPGNVLIDVRADAAVPVLLDWGMHQHPAVWKSTSASGVPENSSVSHFSATMRPP